MQRSLHLVLVCVGVLVAVGELTRAVAAPVASNQSESLVSTEQPPVSPSLDRNQRREEAKANSAPAAPSSLPGRWLQSVQQGAVDAAKRQSISQNSPIDRLLAARQASRQVPMAGAEQGMVSLPQVALPTKQTPTQAPKPALRKLDVKQTVANSVNSLEVAQATTPTPSVTPAGVSPSLLLNSEPAIEPLGKPIGPAKAGAAPAYLNPNPNPLLVPTSPDEVKLRGIQPITLRQALELAERNSPTYQAAQSQADRSRAALRQAQAALYPTLDVQAAATRSESASTNISNRVRAESGTSSFFNQDQDPLSRGLSAAATFSYDVFTSGRRPAQIRAAEQQLRVDQLQVEVAREQLRLDIANAYYDLQSADASVRIGQAAVRNAQISLRDAQALERAGIGTRFDVLRSQVQLANSQQQLTNAIGDQQVNRRQLARRLNIPPGVDLAAADPVEVAGRWTLPLEQSIVLALKNRAELEGLLAQREGANQQRRAALAALGPTLSVSVRYDLLENFRDEVRPGSGYSAQAGLRWTLFDGGAARASAAQQEANIEIAEARFAESRNQIQFDVEQAYANLLANQENIDTAQVALTQATEALRLARLRFQAGVGTQTDVINAETDLTNAQGNLVNAILGYNRSLATLQRAVTNLPIPTGATTPSIPVPVPPGTGTIPSSTGSGVVTP